MILHPNVFGDDRGWFMESFNQQRFEQALNELNLPIPHFVQDNHVSQKGVLRGLHYQNAPYAHVNGAEWYREYQDAAQIFARNQQLMVKWVGVELSAENKTMFWIPEGFAHGFIALEMGYAIHITTNYYNKESEGAIIWNDPNIKHDLLVRSDEFW